MVAVIQLQNKWSWHEQIAAVYSWYHTVKWSLSARGMIAEDIPLLAFLARLDVPGAGCFVSYKHMIIRPPDSCLQCIDVLLPYTLVRMYCAHTLGITLRNDPQCASTVDPHQNSTSEECSTLMMSSEPSLLLEMKERQIWQKLFESSRKIVFSKDACCPLQMGYFVTMYASLRWYPA